MPAPTGIHDLTKLQALAEQIFTVLNPSWPAGTDANLAKMKMDAIKNLKTVLDKLTEYIVAQLVIQGVTTDLNSDALTGNGGGTDTMGGVHVPGGASPTNLAVTGTVTNKAAKQSNDGTGLVL